MINVEKMTPNRSKTYLFPLLSEFYVFPDSIRHLLKNTYIFDEEAMHQNCIYLLFQYDKTPEFTKFEYDLSTVEGYVTHYDLKNNLILYVVKFPNEYIEEYIHFKNSQYSQYGKDAQKLIIRYLRSYNLAPAVTTKIQQIFDRDVKLKLEIERQLGVTLAPDAELGQIITKESETINITKNIKNYHES